MPRTLFQASRAQYVNGTGIAQWSSQAATVPIRGGTVVVHRSTGAWAFFDTSEPADLHATPPGGTAGELLLQLGLVERAADGCLEKVLQPPSLPPAGLHFFEFAVSTGCNLACSYCFAAAPGPREGALASAEAAELFIDRVAQYRATTRSPQRFVIEFTGGEPLLNFAAIKHAIEYAERTYGDKLLAQYCLQTNLTMLTEDRLEFLASHRVSVGVSCDGFAELHDAQRPFRTGRGSHRAVERRIAMLMSRHRECVGGAIAVVSEAGIQRISELMLYLHILGFRSVALRREQKVGRGHAPLDPAAGTKFTLALLECLKSVIEPLYAETGELLEERNLELTFRNLLGPGRHFMCERSPCGAARNICVVMPNGEVYACNQSAGDSRFHLGNLQHHSFVELLQSKAASVLAQRRIDTIPQCRDCAFASWCGSPCPVGAAWATGNLMAKSAECREMRSRYALVLEALIHGALNLDIVGRLAHTEEQLHWTCCEQQQTA